MKKKIFFYSGSRADYSNLKVLIDFLKKKNIKINIATSGIHNSKIFGKTINEIKHDKVKINYRSKLRLNKTDTQSIIKFLGLSFIENYKSLSKSKPSLVLLYGDRYEVLCFGLVAYLCDIPIVHLHGGEVTIGASDDGFRHALTKISNYHFVSHEDYRNRVIQLGENPKNVFNFGSITAENLSKMKFLKKVSLFKKFKIPLNKKIALVTFHPVTKNNLIFKDNINIFLSALKKFDQYLYLITYNNSDILGDYYIKQLNKFKKVSNNVRLFKFMGSKVYLSFLKYSDLIIGNSSSGIYEAPALETPTLNIGNRQLGRKHSSSIINVSNDKKKILRALNRMYKNKKRIRFNNIYFKKNTCQKIYSQLLKILKFKKHNKKFYDLKLN
jgi:GDP/UDP-N,N'-diacetylbacillosamine 2-epimerase (hydrolysing)